MDQPKEKNKPPTVLSLICELFMHEDIMPVAREFDSLLNVEKVQPLRTMALKLLLAKALENDDIKREALKIIEKQPIDIPHLYYFTSTKEILKTFMFSSSRQHDSSISIEIVGHRCRLMMRRDIILDVYMDKNFGSALQFALTAIETKHQVLRVSVLEALGTEQVLDCLHRFMRLLDRASSQSDPFCDSTCYLQREVHFKRSFGANVYYNYNKGYSCRNPLHRDFVDRQGFTSRFF